jgi:hypothetical protein
MEAGHAYEVGGKKNSTIEPEMKYKLVVKVAQTMANYTERKVSYFYCS